MIETGELNKLHIEAEDKKVSLAELCRVKLRKPTQLDRIEGKLDKLFKKINKRKGIN
jgi:hypothetical protein